MINNVTILGRMGNITPKCFNKFNDGNESLMFSMAVKKSHKNEDGSFTTNSEWFSVSVGGSLLRWNRQNFVTGGEIVVEGTLRQKTRNKDGNNVSTVYIDAESVHFMQSVKRNTAESDISQSQNNKIQSNSQSQINSQNQFQNSQANIPQQSFNQQQNSNFQDFPFN